MASPGNEVIYVATVFDHVTSSADDPPADACHRLARLACRLTGAPRAFVSFVIEDREVLQGTEGFPESWASRRELPPDHPLGRPVVAAGAVTAVEDVRRDPRFRDSPAVAELGIVALLGVPLPTRAGRGVLAVAAPEPRAWSEADVAALRDLAETAAPPMPEAADEEAACPEEAILLAGLPNACFLLDADDRLTYLNPRAESLFRQLTGHTPGQLLAKNIWEQCPEVADSTLARQCHRARNEQRGVEVETFYPSFGRWFAIDVVPSHDRLCVFFRDVSDRMRLENALRQRVEELDAADRGKVEFLLQLAHQVRNALAPVRTALHLARHAEPGDAGADQSCDLAEQEVQYLSQLLADLLRISELTPGALRPTLEQVNVGTAVAHALSATFTTVEAGGRQFAIELPAEPLWLEADPRLLGKALAHLLDNAIKFTRPGGRVGLNAERQGEEVVLRVSDDGVGIAADLLPHVFNLFMRAERGLRRAQGGIGIGLALVRRIIELHGGTVEAHSKGPGQGSEFTVRLPATAEAPAKAGEQAVAGDRRHRVLVVDDSVEAAQGIALLLKHFGYEVRVAYDGPTAIAETRTYRPAVVILDIGMPGMNGFQVARRLREEQGSDSLMLVALTGYGSEEDRRHAREAGFDHHLLKPVDLGELKEVLPLPASPVAATTRTG